MMCCFVETHGRPVLSLDRNGEEVDWGLGTEEGLGEGTGKRRRRKNFDQDVK